MAVKIRLQRQGKKKAPWFSIVVANSRSPRDGKYIEQLGTYNPTTIPATISLDNDKALDWMSKGAQPTDTVRRILSYKGVLYKKHLDRGIKKSVITAEKAEQLYQDFVAKHEDQVRRKREEHLNKQKKVKDAHRTEEVKKREKLEAARKPKVEEVAAAETTAEATTVETPVADAPAAETASPESPVSETPATETPVAETPAAEQATVEAEMSEPAASEAPAEETLKKEEPSAPEASTDTPPSEEQPK